MEHERAIAAQHGAAFAKTHMGGVQGFSESNAARHFSRVVQKFGLAFPVPVSELVFRPESGETVLLPYIRPTDYFKTLLKHCPKLLLGGHEPGIAARRELSDFWSRYEVVQSSHAVFQKPEWRSKAAWTIPYSIHGDGGRTAKKQALELVSVEPTLGLLTAEGRTQTCRCVNACAFLGPRLNSKLHSYLSRFLLAAFPAKVYPKGLLAHVLEVLSEELGLLFHAGMEVDGHTHYFACLGLKGDMEFHAQALNLTRSYHNIGTRNYKMVCAECHAGAEDVPFEDVNAGAAWEKTICASFPWSHRPPFTPLPFQDWTMAPSGAAQFFRRDPFHVFRLGSLAAIENFVLFRKAIASKFAGAGDSHTCKTIRRGIQQLSNKTEAFQIVRRESEQLRAFSNLIGGNLKNSEPWGLSFPNHSEGI